MYKGAVMKLHYDGDTRKRVQQIIYAYKRKAGWSQKDMAFAMDIDPSALSQYLNGKIPLNTDFLIQVSRITGAELGKISVQLADVHVLQGMTPTVQRSVI
jgi:transcriptional regulator with XRE-family HTH domain